eukprot:TRINITY_DN76_c5_g1_i2.p1 TRINITY_DN76_c5_g1~~TRINITY_DN76_c5_g1_i2.p1  ORF type:complete len:206 (+),score=31.06 TRINITY_DN76_c5_g1_i2:322-939(+)
MVDYSINVKRMAGEDVSRWPVWPRDPAALALKRSKVVHKSRDSLLQPAATSAADIALNYMKRLTDQIKDRLINIPLVIRRIADQEDAKKLRHPLTARDIVLAIHQRHRVFYILPTDLYLPIENKPILEFGDYDIQIVLKNQFVSDPSGQTFIAKLKVVSKSMPATMVKRLAREINKEKEKEKEKKVSDPKATAEPASPSKKVLST